MPKTERAHAQDRATRRLLFAEVSAFLDRASDNEAAIVRAAKLLDYVSAFYWVLPHNDEFDALLLEHVQWVERQRIKGQLPPGKTIRRPVSKPKARKVKHDAHYRSGGLHK